MPTASRDIRTYDDAVAFIEEALNYEKRNRWAYNSRNLNLARTRELLAALGNPQARCRIVHVAGTKGKGTTSAAVASLLTACGLRTGLLTSPHLVTHRERVRLDGEMISPEDFAAAVRAMQPHVEHQRREESLGVVRAPTYFEMLTALAFGHFAERRADWAVVEVGLGGRLDSTNVVEPACCVVTTIGFDHMDKLGDTAALIAAEKAGIMKPGVPVVIGSQRYPEALETLRGAAESLACPRIEVGRDLIVSDASPMSAPADAPDAPVGWRFALQTPARTYPALSVPLLGRHQLDNVAAAVGAVEACAERGELEFDPAVVRGALVGLCVEGRMELLQRAPALVLDVAHTLESVEALMAALDVHFPGRPVRMVFGCSRDKNVRGMLELFRGRCAAFTATQSKVLSRALPAEDVLAAAVEVGLDVPGEFRAIPDAWEAAEDALSRARPEEVVCSAGSFFTAGEIRDGYLTRHPVPTA